LAKKVGPPKSFKEITDVLIGELALTRRKIDALLEVLDEEGVVSAERFASKLKEKSEKDKLEILMKSLSLGSKEK
jgi:hypothetical protein